MAQLDRKKLDKGDVFPQLELRLADNGIFDIAGYDCRSMGRINCIPRQLLTILPSAVS